MTRMFVIGALVTALAACTQTTSTLTPTAGGTSSAQAAEDPNTVVATVNGKPILLSELDKPMRGKFLALDREHREKKHQMRQAALEATIAKTLVEAEAAKLKLTDEELLKQEVEAKTPAPTDDEVRAFFEQNKARMPPNMATFEQAKDQLTRYLTGEKQKKALFDYFEKLKSAAKVEVTLVAPEEPRIEVAAEGPSKGAADAKVTIVTFSDFECPFCSRANETIEQVMNAYDGKVKLVFRDYPLPFHAQAQKAAEAGQCASAQGKFWEMHDKMFANQKALDVASLKGYAKELALDEAKFSACLDEGKTAELVRKNMEAGEAAGVEGTPAYFINGRMLAGALPFEEFKKVIDAELGVGATAAN